MNEQERGQVANFLYELGSLRKILRAHRQTLLTNDESDNIASHSFRVATIGWFLAKEIGADPYKVVLMCLFHDMGEARGGDQNWVNKRYVKVFGDEIRKDQLAKLPFSDELVKILEEYESRESMEAKVAKDADLLEQILLLKEHAWSGNNEAKDWLKDYVKDNRQYQLLKTDAARVLAEEIYKQNPSDWWANIWTADRR